MSVKTRSKEEWSLDANLESFAAKVLKLKACSLHSFFTLTLAEFDNNSSMLESN